MPFDLPPDPPKLWLPSKPAIIRPATPDLFPPSRDALSRARRRAAGSAAVTTISFHASAIGNDNGSSVTIPATVQDGDAAVWLSMGEGTGGASNPSPSGWTQLAIASNDTCRIKAWTRILTASLAGTVVTGVQGLTSGTDDANVILVFRGNVPITSITSSTWLAQVSSSSPSNQVIPASGQATPLVAVASCSEPGAEVSFTTTSPAFDALIGSAESPSDNIMQAGYKVYNSSPANHTVGMDDLGNLNGMMSGWLRFS